MRAVPFLLLSAVAALEDTTLAESSSLLQSTKMAGAAVGKANTISEIETMYAPQMKLVQTLAKSVVEGGSQIEDEVRDALAEMKETLIGSQEWIQKQHDAEVESLAGMVAAVATTEGEIMTIAETQEYLSGFGTQKEDHDSCREELKTLMDTRNAACDALDAWLANLQVPHSSVPEERSALAGFWTDLKTFYDTNYPIWLELDAACRQANGEVDEQDEICDGKQGEYESDFCAFRHSKYAACHAYETAHEVATGQYNYAWNANGEAARKAEWYAIEKIKCYIDALVDGDIQKVYECNDMDPDTSHLTLPQNQDPVPPGVLPAPLKPCETATTNPYPCTDEWEAENYVNQKDLKICQPCPPLAAHLRGMVAYAATSSPSFPLAVEEESSTELQVNFLTDAQVAAIQNCTDDTGGINFAAMEVSTDLTFTMQRDDSSHSSYIDYIRLDNGQKKRYQFTGGYSDNTRIFFDGKHLECPKTTKSSKCGDLGKDNKVSVILTALHFKPRAGSAHKNQWSRNKYTFIGTKYNVLIPESCKPSL